MISLPKIEMKLLKENMTVTATRAACPQVYSSGGTCTLLPSFLGVHPNFWGCNVPFNSSLHKGLTMIFKTLHKKLSIE
jgi:hypothetical protein